MALPCRLWNALMEESAALVLVTVALRPPPAAKIGTSGGSGDSPTV